MNEGEKLALYSQQLVTAATGHPEMTVWRDMSTAQAYWQQVRNATEWCSGYAGAMITRLQARAANQRLGIQDIIKCETLAQLRVTLGI